MSKELVERVAQAIRAAAVPGSTWTDYALAAIAAMPAQPAALPAEPPPGTVRVHIGVELPRYSRQVEVIAYDLSKGRYKDWKPDAVLVADVKPLTPPEIAATVEGGR